LKLPTSVKKTAAELSATDGVSQNQCSAAAASEKVGFLRKSRNKLGLDVAIEALRFARARKRISNREILHFARLPHRRKTYG
jgi:hypothetical protein